MARFELRTTAALAALVAASMTVRADVPPVDGAGWTVLTPASGAQVFYVSSSSGADTNSGTQTAPFRTIARGLQALRDGHPDQVLLKCGDTWNESVGWSKASGDPMNPMVLASYGSGPRPKIRTTGSGIYGGEQSKSSVIIADLDLAPVGPASGSVGIEFFAPWSHVTIEGCLVSGYGVNIVVQEVDANRGADIHVRRNVVVDSVEPGSGHSQGLFMGSCDNTVVEGNVFDSNANVGPYAKYDIFCHNVYLHQTNGPSIFRDNITARACSHGVQQRSGGTMTGNLAIACPIDLFQGDQSGVPNTFSYNVALDSHDINTANPRGFGFWLNGAAGSTIEYNVAAHQHSGSANVVAFNMDGVNGGILRNNAVYDWDFGGQGWGQAFVWDSGTTVSTFQNNQSYQPSGGECISYAGPGSFSGNRYWSANPIGGYQKFIWQGGGGDFPAWSAYAHESGSTYGNPGSINSTVDAYMQSIGMSGSVPEFMTQARLQSKQNWRAQFTTTTVNNWVRGRFGLGSAVTCYANCDGSTGTPILNAGDFQCFLNRFTAGDVWANCDGSTAAPVLNANDFQCFLSKFAAGCP